MTPTDPLTPHDRLLCRAARQACATEDRPRFDDDTQRALAMSWQHAQALKSVQGYRRNRASRRLVDEGEQDLAALMKSLEGFIRHLAGEMGTRRLGRKPKLELFEDMCSEGRIAALETLADFDPGRASSVMSFVAYRVRSALTNMPLDDGGRALSADRLKVGRVALGIGSLALGHLPADELAQRVLAQFEGTKATAIMARQPDISPEDLAAKVHDRLSRQGVHRALTELPDILEAIRPPLSLDAPAAGDDGTLTLSEMVPSNLTVGADDEVVEDDEMAAVMLEGMCDRDYKLVIARHGKERPSAKKLGQMFDLEPGEVRQIVRRTMARVHAPHTQFARLAPDVPGLVTHVDDHSPAARMARHRARASA